MRWRPIGPFRGGRTKAITGVPSQPGVFYMAPVNGGVWKTDDYGRIVDADLRRSADRIDWRDRGRAVRSERHLRRQRRRTRASGSLGRRRHLQVDRRGEDLDAPRPPRRSADSVHHRRPAKSEPAVRRGPRPSVRTERGARHLPLDRRRRDVPEGARRRTRTPADRDLEFDPRNPDIVYACLWEQRQGPWENGAWAGVNGGHLQIDRRRHDVASADAGPADQPADGSDGIVQADIAIAPSDPNRIYATVANPRTVGIYRSDDAGETGRGSRPTRGRRAASAAAICRCRSSIRRTRTP